MKHVHFIGVAGSAIAPIAIMMKEKGWRVTGSDEGVFEPARTLLENAGVEWFEDYSAERVDNADLVIIGGGPLLKDLNNPEFLRSKELGKQLEGFPYLLGEYVTKDESIVVAGSYGKTTTTGLINWILDTAGKNPSYMIGGKPHNYETGVRATDSDYSCVEGDEFVSVFGFDIEPKFVYYKPKYALLSAAKWDHVNVYPTEELYVEAYQKLRKGSEELGGKMYICASGTNNEKIIAEMNPEHKYVTYMVEDNEIVIETEPDYVATNIEVNGTVTSFDVLYEDEVLGRFESKMIGTHNVENSLAAICVMHDIGIPIEVIQKGCATYGGIKRRLDFMGETAKGAIVIDDFAHSAMKAEATLTALRSTYPSKKIIGVYYPRPSSRENRAELEFYRGAFDAADLVLIPRIFVKKSTPKDERIYGKDIISAIKTTQPNVEYQPVEEALIERIKAEADSNSIVVFMSAGGWGRVMDEVLKI